MPQDARSSAEKLRSTAPRLLAAGVFLASMLASFSNCLAKDYNEVIAVEASTGRLLWRYQPWRLSDGANFEMYKEGMVVLENNQPRVFLDSNTGKPIESFKVQSSECLARSFLPKYLEHSRIRLDNGWELLESSCDDSGPVLRFLKGPGGKTVWEIPTSGSVDHIDCWKNFVFFWSKTPAFHKGKDTILRAYEAGAALPAWTADLNRFVKGRERPLIWMGIQVVEDTVYAEAEGHVFVFDPTTGKLLWHRDLAQDLGLRFYPDFWGGPSAWCPLAGFNKSQGILVISFEKRVLALDSKTMKYLWQIDLCPGAWRNYTYPIMNHGGKVFLGSSYHPRIYQAVEGDRPPQGEPVYRFQELDWHDVPLVTENLSFGQQLYDAVCEHSFEKAHKLIDAGADVNTKDAYGITVLHIAASRPRREEDVPKAISLLRHLVNAGANIDAGIETGRTPLMRAISDERLALELINAGAKPTYPKGTESPLHSVNCSPGSMRVLIAAGADVNTQDAAGQTPLHNMVFRIDRNKDNKEEYQVIRMLVEAGADLSIKDNGGQNPIECARSNRRPKIADFMESLKKDARPKPPNRPAQPAPSPGPPAPGGSAKPAEAR